MKTQTKEENNGDIGPSKKHKGDEIFTLDRESTLLSRIREFFPQFILRQLEEIRSDQKRHIGALREVEGEEIDY